MYTRREIGRATFSKTLTISLLFIKWRSPDIRGVSYFRQGMRGSRRRERRRGRRDGCQLSGNGCSPTFYLKQYPARTAKISAIREFRDEFLLSKTSTSPGEEILLFVRGRMYGRVPSYKGDIFKPRE